MEQTCLLDLKNENLSLVVTLSDIDSEKNDEVHPAAFKMCSGF